MKADCTLKPDPDTCLKTLPTVKMGWEVQACYGLKFSRDNALFYFLYMVTIEDFLEID